MAIMCGTPLGHLVLVDAAGLRPQASEALDVFVTPWRDVIERGFFASAESSEYQRLYGQPMPEYGGIREAGRMMSIRMCFKPYMSDPALESMLGKIQTPTLVVWGSDDRIVPPECGERYQRAIPNAELRVLKDCGHFAHLEQPSQLAHLVDAFCSGGA
jgi:pimeloyl-ACP methyl ester carboxylesterase